MPKMENTTFICLDCETTGLETKKDEIIEIAIAKFTMHEIAETYETLIAPPCSIPESSIKIHHITEEMVKGKPRIQNVLPKILEMVGTDYVVGHNILFDIEMINQAANTHQIPCKLLKNPTIDTLRMARLYGNSPTNSLEQLGKHFNIEIEESHRAMSDVKVNVDVFRQLAKKYKTLEQLLKLLSKPILLKVMPLGKYKGRKMGDIPLHYLEWVVKFKFDQDLSYTLRTEIKRRKKGDSFSQISNPFLNL